MLQAGVALAASLWGGRGFARRRSDAILEPLFAVTGARVVTRTDVAGGAMPDAFGQYVPLIQPVAAAAAFGDIYIADAGASRLYRYDRALDAMAVLPETRIAPTTRLQAGADGSVYVLDAFSSEIRRYTRGGQPLPTLRPRLATSRYGSFAVDRNGRVYAVDSAHLVVDEIQPLGNLALELLRLDAAGPVAVDAHGLLVGDPNCGCVVEWIGGRRGRTFGGGKLRLPLSIAVDGPKIFALDGHDRSISLAHEEGAETVSAASLGLTMPESLTAAAGMILVADSVGRRVTAFRPGSRPAAQ